MTLTGKKYLIKTYGCQMNERDSEIIAGILESCGAGPACDLEDADILVFNTCCIREKAEQKAISNAGALKKWKAQREDRKIIITGCMTQQKGKPESLLKSLPHVDVLAGTHNIHRIGELLEQSYADRPVVEIWEDGRDIQEGLPKNRTNNYRALINITFGCDNYCTYCIVPYVRGRERSREMNDILEEVRDAVAGGIREVMFLGQNVNSYGNDLDEATDFLTLLEKAAKIEGLERIRFMTSHPKDFSPRLAELIGKEEKIASHVHLPVQHGSNKILDKMNRKYTREHYLELIDAVRKNIPDAVITTDLIVGFPGETEEDFQATVNLVREVRYDSAFTFVYSPRSGTPAALLEDNNSLKVKKERLAVLNDVVRENSLGNNLKHVGRTEKILVEKWDPETGTASGKNYGMKNVVFFSDRNRTGDFLQVKITEALDWILKGELVDE